MHIYLYYVPNSIYLIGNSAPALCHQRFTCDRWIWSLRMADDKIASLPSSIGMAVEKLVCQHRKERKLLFEKKPNKWVEKMKETNGKTMSIVYNIRHSCLATARFIRNSTAKVAGQLQFTTKGNGHEILRVHFELEDGAAPDGKGIYYLSSLKFEKRPICCVSATGQWTGFDHIRETYGGQKVAVSCVSTLTSHYHRVTLD